MSAQVPRRTSVDLRLDGINDSRAAAREATLRRIEDHRGAAGAARGEKAVDPPPALHEDLIGSAKPRPSGAAPKFCLKISSTSHDDAVGVNAIDAGINQPHSLHERERA